MELAPMSRLCRLTSGGKAVQLLERSYPTSPLAIIEEETEIATFPQNVPCCLHAYIAGHQ